LVRPSGGSFRPSSRLSWPDRRTGLSAGVDQAVAPAWYEPELGGPAQATCRLSRTRTPGLQSGRMQVVRSSEDVRKEIDGLREEIVALEGALDEGDAAVSVLSAELDERRGRLTLTQRALDDYRERLAGSLLELEETIADEARRALEATLRRREKAASLVAQGADALLDGLETLDKASEAALVAWSTWTSSMPKRAQTLEGTSVPPELESEPEVMRESWQRLCDEVRQRVGHQFERDLVEAAARSPLGHAINQLPTHLQELARQRHRALVRQTSPPRAERSSNTK
jgi:cell division septum initiation protein DivIVA